MNDDEEKRDAQEVVAAMMALTSSLSEYQWHLLFRMVHPIVRHVTPDDLQHFMAPMTTDQQHQFMDMWQTCVDAARCHSRYFNEGFTTSGGIVEN